LIIKHVQLSEKKNCEADLNFFLLLRVYKKKIKSKMDFCCITARYPLHSIEPSTLQAFNFSRLQNENCNIFSHRVHEIVMKAGNNIKFQPDMEKPSNGTGNLCC
jgi:hypothetical protein